MPVPLMTWVAETIVRDRFEDQTDRTLHASEVSDWAASTITVRSPLIVVDLRALVRMARSGHSLNQRGYEGGPAC
jgi:hypothetical protein